MTASNTDSPEQPTQGWREVLAVLSVLAGVVGWTSTLFVSPIWPLLLNPLPLLPGPTAIILGHVSRHGLQKGPTRTWRLSRVGMILGFLHLLCCLALIVWLVWNAPTGVEQE